MAKEHIVPKKMKPSCETCEFFDWDDDYQDNVCTISLDEDELYRMKTNAAEVCPYYRYYNEYKSVQKQI